MTGYVWTEDWSIEEHLFLAESSEYLKASLTGKIKEDRTKINSVIPELVTLLFFFQPYEE
jgi:hypothetical protein